MVDEKIARWLAGRIDGEGRMWHAAGRAADCRWAKCEQNDIYAWGVQFNEQLTSK